MLPLIWYLYRSKRKIHLSKFTSSFVDILMCFLGLTIGVPMSVSLFEREMYISVNKLENKFKYIKDEKGFELK